MSAVLFDINGRPLKKEKPKRDLTTEPTINTTHDENVTIRRFFRFALDDVLFQAHKLETDTSIPEEKRAPNREIIAVLTAYLVNHLKEFDRLIKSIDPADKGLAFVEIENPRSMNVH